MTSSRVVTLLFGVVLATASAGCAGSKQDAAVALDAARLAVSDSRKGPAATNAAGELRTAERRLESAEQAFRNKNYELALSESKEAVERAKAADATGKKLAAAKKEPIRGKDQKAAEKPKKKYDKTKYGSKL